MGCGFPSTVCGEEEEKEEGVIVFLLSCETF